MTGLQSVVSKPLWSRLPPEGDGRVPAHPLIVTDDGTQGLDNTQPRCGVRRDNTRLDQKLQDGEIFDLGILESIVSRKYTKL
jgi:hypothetical protein